MCRKVITADGQQLETVKQLRTILSDDDIVLKKPVQFSGVLWGGSCLCPIDLEATFNRLGWKFQTNEFNDVALKAHYGPIDITDARNHIDVRETITTPDYRVKWQVVFKVGPHPECIIATCDTFEEASDEANRFGASLKKLIAAIVKE